MKTIIFSILMCLSVSVFANTETIEQSVVQSMEDVRHILRSHPDDYPTLYRTLEYELADIIDYEAFGKGILGKYYRELSEEEFKEFVDNTKQKVFRMYIGIAIQNADFYYKIIDVKYHSKNDNLAGVRLEVGDVPYEVVYYMKRNNNKWLIYNIAAEGVNFGIIMKEQFQLMVREYKNLKAALKFWNSTDNV